MSKKQYAIYKKAKFLFMGTAKECARYFKVKVKTVYFWASPANMKYADTGQRPGRKPRKKECSGVKIAIRVEE